ncbi:MAG: hypothetical protein ACR2PZ_13100 [Pseudomonadales bacterium]
MERTLARRAACWISGLLALAFVLSGCASTGIERQARTLGMQERLVAGAPFTHRIYATNSASERAQSPSKPLLIVLIDGDGRAFIDRETVASDPTAPRSELLKALSAMPSRSTLLFLGRPCYHQTADAQCHPRYWTTHRYSEAVVSSMAAALGKARTSELNLLLVGYSGGGVLATLLAERLADDTAGLITVAAPLGTDQWANHHGYSQLVGSLRPNLEQVRLSSDCQRHLYGQRDLEVPLELARRWMSPYSQALVETDANHRCCWGTALVNAIEQISGTCSRP